MATGRASATVIAFSCVKKSNPCGPYAFASPNSESFQPPNEWYATGTGIGTLMPIMPTVHLALEAPRGAAVVREDRRAVAVLARR